MTLGRPLLQYFCSECNTLLTETDKSIDFISSSEECPKCGSLLSKTLKRQTPERYDRNSSDVYQCVNFARQYGFDIKDILRRIIVSRPFTIYQLANLVTYELPRVMRKFDTKLIIISDILRMFLDDPQVKVGESRRLIKKITNTFRKL